MACSLPKKSQLTLGLSDSVDCPVLFCLHLSLILTTGTWHSPAVQLSLFHGALALVSSLRLLLCLGVVLLL